MIQEIAWPVAAVIIAGLCTIVALYYRRNYYVPPKDTPLGHEYHMHVVGEKRRRRIEAMEGLDPQVQMRIIDSETSLEALEIILHHKADIKPFISLKPGQASAGFLSSLSDNPALTVRELAEQMKAAGLWEPFAELFGKQAPSGVEILPPERSTPQALSPPIH